MSNEWQSLRRCSHLGPKSGQSLSQSQPFLPFNDLKQKSRRVSLNTNSAFSLNSRQNCGLNQDLTQSDCSSVETHSPCQSAKDYCPQQQQNTTSSCNPSSSKTERKLSKNCFTSGLSEGLTQSLCSVNTQNIYCNNSVNTLNCNSSSGGLSAVMLPIINFDNVVTGRQSIDMTGRMSRRSSKAAQDSFMCSQQSILSAMDRFVKAVNNMDSTVLVPSKLRDMDTTSPKLVRIPPALANTDLHSFYLMLNDVKKELLWGPGTQHSTTSLIPMSGRSSPRELKHIRQPSDDSLGSLGSTASSSSDQDTDSEADSLMTDRDSVDEHTSHLAAAFRHHLQGLHTILHQLADSADYLSSRYQEDIDASSL